MGLISLNCLLLTARGSFPVNLTALKLLILLLFVCLSTRMDRGRYNKEVEAMPILLKYRMLQFHRPSRATKELLQRCDEYRPDWSSVAVSSQLYLSLLKYLLQLLFIILNLALRMAGLASSTPYTLTHSRHANDIDGIIVSNIYTYFSMANSTHLVKYLFYWSKLQYWSNRSIYWSNSNLVNKSEQISFECWSARIVSHREIPFKLSSLSRSN